MFSVGFCFQAVFATKLILIKGMVRVIGFLGPRKLLSCITGDTASSFVSEKRWRG